MNAKNSCEGWVVRERERERKGSSEFFIYEEVEDDGCVWVTVFVRKSSANRY